MKTIYLIKYDNGEEGRLYEEFTFKYCYNTKSQANQAIEELKQDNDFLESMYSFNPENVHFWIEEMELVD